MAALEYPAPIRQLIWQLKSLPGIGPRSAERLVLWLLSTGATQAPQLADALKALGSSVEMCEACGFYSECGTQCALCSDDRRQRAVVCVVEQAADVLRLERSGAFRGQYHVLGGKLSPLDNVTPEDLRIAPLLHRVRDLPAEEVILALSSDVEGEATANYIADLLRRAEIKVTRLAQGMPAGGGLDHVDEMTLFRALEGRRTI
ncbi:MAG: recombination protein RecR [Verrucomicrobiaceae bacterium]|nr:recombination protein RecR [Verrucomicrobiaceae bacterium]